jgi:hypothetical protein
MKSDEEKYTALPPALMNALVAYLVTRPFREVVGLIQGFEQQGVPVDPPKKEQKE